MNIHNTYSICNESHPHSNIMQNTTQCPRFVKCLLSLETQIRNRIRRGEGGFILFADTDGTFQADLRLNLETKSMILNNVSFKNIEQLGQFFDSIDALMNDSNYAIMINNRDQIPQEFYLTRVCRSSCDPLWSAANQRLANFYNTATYRMCAPNMSVQHVEIM